MIPACSLYYGKRFWEMAPGCGIWGNRAGLAGRSRGKGTHPGLPLMVSVGYQSSLLRIQVLREFPRDRLPASGELAIGGLGESRRCGAKALTAGQVVPLAGESVSCPDPAPCPSRRPLSMRC